MLNGKLAIFSSKTLPSLSEYKSKRGIFYEKESLVFQVLHQSVTDFCYFCYFIEKSNYCSYYC